MMSTLHVWIFIYVLIIALCATRGNYASPATSDGDDDSGERAVLLRRAFKQLLRLKSLPADRPDAARPAVASPPRYMLELYERYRRGDANSAGKNRGNTVRSILAQKGNINGAEMLLFNLSGIDTAVEDILHSELHFNRRKKVKWLDRSVDKPFFLMEFFIISSKDVQVKPLATVNITSRTIVSGRRGGWQVLDVTKQVNECQKKFPDLSDDGDLNHLIAIKFRTLNRRSKLVDLSLRALIRMDNMPFLIIFSNDKDNDTETVDDLDINMTQKFLKDSNEEQETRIKNDGTLMGDDAISPLKRYPRSVGDSNHIEEVDYGVKQSTLMSWVDNNEYPENSVHSGQDFLAKTGPGILIPRKRHRMEQQANRTIPYPVVGGPFGHRRRMKKKKNATLPISWQDKIRKEKGKKIIAGLGSRGNDVGVKVVPSAKESDNVGCHRKRLSVDFADLHWGDRIISPKSFEAYYCAGRCQFPLVKESNPSNHAIIQSIVNAVGINQDVPAPCCVASAMSSLSLLYFEDNGIVVLKNYPGMIVESCACR